MSFSHPVEEWESTVTVVFPNVTFRFIIDALSHPVEEWENTVTVVFPNGMLRFISNMETAQATDEFIHKITVVLPNGEVREQMGQNKTSELLYTVILWQPIEEEETEVREETGWNKTSELVVNSSLHSHKLM